MPDYRYPHEDHQAEQYFFAPDELDRLCAFITAGGWRRVACLCAPMLGSVLTERMPEVEATILDRDQRFAHLPGFVDYNIGRPPHLEQRFDLIVCDPPFFTVSLSTLFAAVRTLAHNDFTQPLLLSYLARRAGNVVGTFAPFGLTSTGAEVTYLTVQASERNRTLWLSNLADDQLAGL